MFDLLFPTYCINCGRTGNYLCTVCKKKLKNNLPECYVCRRVSNQYTTHKKCNMHNIENVFIGWEYNSIAKKILSQYKYRYAYKLSEILSQLLLERLRVTKFLDLIQSDSLLVPIPSHHSHIQKRGFNQSYLIAQYLSNFLKIPLGKNLITRIGNSNYQSTKSLNDRKQLKDVFKPIEDIKGKNIVILDDVITTGTTLNRVSKSLKGNNIKAIVLFRGRPRFHL